MARQVNDCPWSWDWFASVDPLVTVDHLAPGPHLPRWIADVHKQAKLDLDGPAFERWVRRMLDAPLSSKKPLTRSEARLAASTRDGPDDEKLDEKEPWEAEQDVAAFQSWRSRLAWTRNVPGPAALSAEVHIGAGWIDIRLDLERMTFMFAESDVHIRAWHREMQVRDRGWLKETFGLSTREAQAIGLYVRGVRQQAVALHLGVATSTAKELLHRAREKMRKRILSPSTAPLRMKGQLTFKRERAKAGDIA